MNKRSSGAVVAGAALAVWCWIGHPGVGQACQCPEPLPPDEALQQADAVFLGTLTKFELIGHLDMSAGPQTSLRWVRVATFDAVTVWKSTPQPFITVSTGLKDEDCGYDFIVGRQYLVYASGQADALQTGRCARTRGVEQAGDDLVALGSGTPAVSEPK